MHTKSTIKIRKAHKSLKTIRSAYCYLAYYDIDTLHNNNRHDLLGPYTTNVLSNTWLLTRWFGQHRCTVRLMTAVDLRIGRSICSMRPAREYMHSASLKNPRRWQFEIVRDRREESD